nr:uncharacterized protein LOC120973960 isoform X2 [Aegilops tauschii subsp. strangulata]
MVLPELEVELDSLGHLFIELANAYYSQDNTETSWASEAEKAQREGESRRQTRSSSGELVAGLSNIPSARKRRTEESPPSSTDSIGTQLPPFTINQGKIVESSATPTVNESQDLQQGNPEIPVTKTNLDDPQLAKEPILTDKPPMAEEDLIYDQAQPDEPVDHLQPPSLTHTPSPHQEPENANQMIVDAEVVITGTGHGAANTSTSWTKIPAKDEPACEDKGKAKLELPGFDNMTSEELQHEFLTRLSESRDIEANIVNMLKKKHEIKAESSMQSTVEELEKVKAAFDKERASFETQKSVLKDN